MQVGSGFGMHRDDVSARLSNRTKMALGFKNHHMDVNGQLSRSANLANDDRPKRQVGYEPPIHHVHMDKISAAFLQNGYLIGQVPEITMPSLSALKSSR